MDVRASFRALKGLILVGSALWYVAGCTHTTAVVKEETGKNDANGNPIYLDLPGIPFYAKKGVCNEQSVWLEPQYALIFTVKADDQPPITRTLVVSRVGYREQSTQDLIKTLTGLKSDYKLPEIYPNLCPSSLGGKWDTVANLVGKTADDQPQTGLDTNQGKLMDAERSGNVLLVANESRVGVVPDYSHHEYLNTLSPWNGSAQVDAKIAGDGTLSEGSVQRDDETLNAVLSNLAALVGDFTGVSTAAGGVAAAQPAASQGRAVTEEQPKEGQNKKPKPAPAVRFCAATKTWPGVMKRVEYDFQIKTSLYKHDHRLQVPLPLDGVCKISSPLYDGNFSVTLEEPGGSSKSDNSINFSGQVKLPEDTGKHKKDDKGSPK
jgi:hypothetical protein